MMTSLAMAERLGRATDRSAMSEWLQHHLAVLSPEATSIADLYIPRVFPHADGGLAIQYVVRVTGTDRSTPASLILWGHLLDDKQPWPDYTSAHTDRCIRFDQIRLAVLVFPFDPTLDVIERMMQPGWQLPRPTDIEPQSPFESENYQVRSAQLLSYRLMRRCTLKLRLAPEEGSRPESSWTLVAKVMRPKRAKQIYTSSQNLTRQGFGRTATDGLTIPSVYAVDTERGVIYMEAVAGVTLHDAVETGNFAEISRQAGRILRKLHALDVPHETNHTPVQELEMLTKLSASLHLVYPEGTSEIAVVIAALESRLSEVADFEPSVIHRDFFDKQVVHYGDRTTLLDWMPGAVGDPAVDLGNFLAHLRLRVLQHPESAPLIEAGRSSFAEGYMSIDVTGSSRVQWWKAAALVRLACLYALRPRWRALAPELLREARIYQGKDTRTVGRDV